MSAEAPTEMVFLGVRDLRPTTGSTTGATAIPRKIRHTSSGPVDLASCPSDLAFYPSLDSDPSYAKISRELRPEPEPEPVVVPSRDRGVIAIFALAFLSGIALALIDHWVS